MNILLVYIKNYKYGNGHYCRLLNVKKQLSNNIGLKLLNIAKKKNKKILFSHLKNKKIKILFDISNKKFLDSNKKYLEKIFKKIKECKHELSLIDDVKINSVLNYLHHIEIKNYINPYIDSLKKKNLNIKNKFLGENFHIGLNRYPKYRIKKNKVKNILIFLTASKNTINIKLANLIIKEKVFFSRYKINFITADYLFLKKKNNPKFLKFLKILNYNKFCKKLKICDYVISGQGNFKYEMLFAGYPLIVVAENKYYLSIKKRFKKTHVLNINKLIKIKTLLLKNNFNNKTLKRKAVLKKILF